MRSHFSRSINCYSNGQLNISSMSRRFFSTVFVLLSVYVIFTIVLNSTSEYSTPEYAPFECRATVIGANCSTEQLNSTQLDNTSRSNSHDLTNVNLSHVNLLNNSRDLSRTATDERITSSPAATKETAPNIQVHVQKLVKAKKILRHNGHVGITFDHDDKPIKLSKGIRIKSIGVAKKKNSKNNDRKTEKMTVSKIENVSDDMSIEVTTPPPSTEGTTPPPATEPTEEPTPETSFAKAVKQAKKKQQKAGMKILFYHFHKAGGTAMCRLARRNHMNAPAGNCLDRTWDYRASIGGLMEHQNCLFQEKQFLHASPFTFISLEFHFNLLQNCSFSNFSGIRTLSTIREPVARLASQWMYDVPKEFIKLKKTATIIDAVSNPNREFYIDNYQTRRILGRIGPRMISSEPLTLAESDLAISLLNGIDIVVPLELLCTAEPFFRREFGWLVPPMPAGRSTMFANETVVARLRELNWADTRLHKAAKLHYERSMQKWGLDVSRNCSFVVKHVSHIFDEAKNKPVIKSVFVSGL